LLEHGPRSAAPAEVGAPRITTDPAGVAAVLNALNGGAGHEFVTLVRREVHNPGAVIAGFVSGRYVIYSIPGLVAKVANAQPLYSGPGLDRMFLTEAGGVLLKGGVLELAAIMRGPFFRNSATTTVVFGINRGEGAALGPSFPGRPGITPDALVTITTGPFGQSNSATVTDLTSGSVHSISSSAIQVEGPVARVLVPISLLPSKGFSIKHYRFTAWTQIVQYAGTSYPSDITSVGSFAPEDSMIPIGVLTTVRPPAL
jgi:hypothetical protein